MIRLPARFILAACAALAPAAMMAAPLTAQTSGQQSPGTFNLPPPTPTPTPAPAGPSDERAGVVIPPRAAPVPRPTATPTPQPTAVPSAPQPTPVRTPAARSAVPAPSPVPSFARPGRPPAPVPTVDAPLPATGTAPAPLPTASGDPLTLPPSSSGAPPEAGPVAADPPAENTDSIIAFPAWAIIAAGAAGALAVLGGGLFLRRRRKPKVLRLAAPAPLDLASGAAAARGADGGQSAAPDLADLHLSLDITTATRSVMMFTVHYRLNIANRSARAVADMRVAVQMVCARASANSPGANAASVGAEQALGETPRIGPHQARSIIGEVQMPLSAIQPLRQGTTPLFVPLIHVTIEAEGQPALTRTFVIGTPSASGRVHPIQLDQPPGGIAGRVAQAVAVPSASAAA